MNDDPFYSAEEIENLTDKKRRPAQLRVLKAIGVEHKVRPDGSIAILRAHINKVFDGEPAASPARGKAKVAVPNWKAI